MRPAWMADAACRGMSPARFYPVPGVPAAAALAVCAGCPVRDACDEHASATAEVHGIWGGRLEIERRTRRMVDGDRRPGPPPMVADEDLAELVDGLDPNQPAAGQLRARLGVSVPTAYKVLGRARRLGLVEQRGRNLYPARSP